MTEWTPSTLALWGKIDPESQAWMPLVQHLSDSADIAGVLWDEWVSEVVRRRILKICGSADSARSLVVFLAGIHDIGKCSPDFQRKAELVPGFAPLTSRLHSLGFDFQIRRGGRPAPHGLVGQQFCDEALAEMGISPRAANSFSTVIGAHHGQPISSSQAVTYKASLYGYGSGAWDSSRHEIWETLVCYSGFAEHVERVLSSALPSWAQIELNGIVVMADWMASNTELFPLTHQPAGDRLESATKTLDLPDRWNPPAWHGSVDELLLTRFPTLEGRTARPLQRAAVAVSKQLQESGMLVIEAPMGSGKTEAALLAAEVMAGTVGSDGVLVALPTMATSNPMFSRVQHWLTNTSGARHTTLNLVHGKAALNDDYRSLRATGQTFVGIDDGDDSAGVYVASWFLGRWKAGLASNVVCTIDQVLFAALRHKHVMLRQLGLTNKVVIIDEVHAADEFMRVYLEAILCWLGTHRVPVILMSATLPPLQRHRLVNAYAQGFRGSGREIDVPVSTNYPRLTLVQDSAVDFAVGAHPEPLMSVEFVSADDSPDSLVSLLRDQLAGGGCAGVSVPRSLAPRSGIAH